MPALLFQQKTGQKGKPMFLLLLLGVLLAWLSSRILFKKYWNRGLSVQITFKERSIYEGERSTMKETVINDKLLPLPALEVRFSSSRYLEFLNEASANTSATDNCYKRDVFSFLFHQKIERTLPFTAGKRGLYQIYEVTCIGYDFFFRSGYYMDIPQQTALYVYPRQVDTHRIRLLCTAISGAVLSRNRLFPDPFEFSGIREYRREDPVNHINWKASARTGELMTNQFDSTTSIFLTLIFDLEDKLILKYEDLVEETIRITSSLAARLMKSRMSFHIISNAADPLTRTPFSMNLDADSRDMEKLNQKLACMDSKETVLEMDALLQQEAACKKSGHTYVFISKNREEALISRLRLLAAGNNEILWVIPIRPADISSLRPFSEPHITCIPWEI